MKEDIKAQLGLGLAIAFTLFIVFCVIVIVETLCTKKTQTYTYPTHAQIDSLQKAGYKLNFHK